VHSTPTARALRRLRWPVVALWVLAFLALGSLAGSLHKITNDTASAYLPSSAQSTRVALLQEAMQHGPDHPQSDSVAVVFSRAARVGGADISAAAAARSAVVGLVGHVRGLKSPAPVQHSGDGRAAFFVASIVAPSHSVSGVDRTAVDAIRRVVTATARPAGAGLDVFLTGQAALNADSGGGGQGELLITAVAIVGAILLIVYRSPLLWLLPLTSAFAAIVVAEAAAHGLASAGLTVSSLSTAILTVLVFGAASDYALLLIHRYREELYRHAAAEDAMAAALRHTVPTLLASAATVIGAMLTLLAAHSASLHGLGPIGAVAVVSALLAQTTFLPAVLLVAGRRAFWPRAVRDGDSRGADSRLWTRIGEDVARRRVPVALAAVTLLIAACAGLVALHIDNNPLDNLKGNPESVVGARLLANHSGPGIIAPLVVLVPPSHAIAAGAAARHTANVASVSSIGPVDGYAGYSATLSVDPYSPQGYAAVDELRHRLADEAPGSLVGGPSAIQHDITRAARRDTLVLMPLVLVVILLVVTLLLRAIIAPLVLVATTALSFAASFALANLLWRYALGYAGIQSELPLYIFIFLVALGVDYNIFLSARIREEARALGTYHGTVRALAMTGGVITAAGIVLAATFAALAQKPAVSTTEVGIAVALGELIDTLLVRTVLVPAALLSIGDRVWWPRLRLRVGSGARR
jgi:RND superfamily putative drug exporter